MLSYYKILIVGLLCLFVFQEASSKNVDATSENKVYSIPESRNYVLIINCHLETINWRYNYEDEIIEYVGSQNNLNVYAEHIKSLNIESKEMLEKKCDELLAKYTIRPEVVVFIGPAAYQMFAKAFNDKWNNIPMLYLGPKKRETSLDDLLAQRDVPMEKMSVVSDSAMQKRYNVTGIWSFFHIKETFDLMFRTIKDLDRVVWIGDNRQGSMVARMQAKNELSTNFPDLKVEFLSPDMMTTNELIKKVASYNEHTGILFHSWYTQGDNTEEYYISNNLYKTLNGFASAPVFTLWDMNTEMGYIAGGHYVLMRKQSETAIGLLKRILAGEPAKSIEFVELNDHNDYLNFSNLSEYGKDHVSFPSNVVYFQKPESFFYLYRYQLLCLTFIAILIIVYFYYRMSLYKRTQKLQNHELEMQKKLQQEIVLRNFKLALSMQVSTVRPWVIDISDQTISYDDVEAVVTNPQSQGTLKTYTITELLSWLVSEEDVEKFRGQMKSLADGLTPYTKDDYKMRKMADDDSENWYTIQAVVYERNYYGKPIKLIGTAMKITDSKNKEIELCLAKEKAEESNRLKTAFIANMSHEIRTPLNAIVGFSGIIAQSTTNEKTQELAAIIQHNNSLLLKLINDILDLSNIESGAFELTNYDFDINKLLSQLCEEYKIELSSSVELIEAKPLKNGMMRSDKRQVYQVMENLMSNAIKFTKKGSVTIGYYPPKDGKIRLFVKDTGCGIPKNKLNTIFGRFIKLNNFEQGTGLGLSLCQLIADKMGGHVGVFSEVGKGSEFWFEIPYEFSAKSAEVNDIVINHPTTVSADKHKAIVILVAEDDESNFIILNTILKKDYLVVHAWNGKEAVDCFKKYNPAIVLMDVRMPEKDGYQATAEIRKLSQSVPIIAISAYTLDNDIERLFERGFSAYEPKPINRNSLKNRIISLLGGI